MERQMGWPNNTTALWLFFALLTGAVFLHWLFYGAA